MVTTSDRSAVAFSITAGNIHDAAPGRALLDTLGHQNTGRILIMDRAYEGDKTRMKAEYYGYTPVVPPKKNRKESWEYDKVSSGGEF